MAKLLFEKKTYEFLEPNNPELTQDSLNTTNTSINIGTSLQLYLGIGTTTLKKAAVMYD